MKDNRLKKEFKAKDVERVRNLVKKDFTSKSNTSTGYKRRYESHKEGDVWEEDGRTWTIKNGIKQNITKLDTAKKASQVPLVCPKCGGSMKHHLSKKMWKIHRMCFNCVIDYEAQLRKAGLYEQYEKAMVQGNMRQFVTDIEQWVLEAYDQSNFVTEDGVIEDWNSNNSAKEKALSNVKEFIEHVNKELDKE